MKKYTYPADLIMKRLNEYLFKRSKSLYQFSKEACISLSTLKNMLNGHTKAPKITLIYQMADALEVELCEFLNADYLRNANILKLV